MRHRGSKQPPYPTAFVRGGSPALPLTKLKPRAMSRFTVILRFTGVQLHSPAHSGWAGGVSSLGPCQTKGRSPIPCLVSLLLHQLSTRQSALQREQVGCQQDLRHGVSQADPGRDVLSLSDIIETGEWVRTPCREDVQYQGRGRWEPSWEAARTNLPLCDPCMSHFRKAKLKQQKADAHGYSGPDPGSRPTTTMVEIGKVGCGPSKLYT